MCTLERQFWKYKSLDADIRGRVDFGDLEIDSNYPASTQLNGSFLNLGFDNVKEFSSPRLWATVTSKRDICENNIGEYKFFLCRV